MWAWGLGGHRHEDADEAPEPQQRARQLRAPAEPQQQDITTTATMVSPGNLGCCLQLLVLMCNLGLQTTTRHPWLWTHRLRSGPKLLSLPQPRCAVEIATSRGQAQQGDEDPQRLLEADTLLPHESRTGGDDVLG